MFVLVVILTYLIIITIIVSRNQAARNNPNQKTNKWNIAFAYTFFIISVIAFQVCFFRLFILNQLVIVINFYFKDSFYN